MINKKLGYTTNSGNGESALKKKIPPINASYGENLLSGNNEQPLIEPAKTEVPVDLKYQQNLGNIQGATNGGVTDESAIIGDRNLVNLPHINDNYYTSYSANLPNIAASRARLTSATENGEQAKTPLPQKPETGATGSAGTESGEKIESYDDFTMKQGGYYKEMYEKLLEQIERNEQNTIQQAELEYRRNIIDAKSSQELNKATYGRTAEELARLGLTGSGYSDYLNQQAYATQRAETQAASARAEAAKIAAQQQASTERANAELSYAQNEANEKEQKMLSYTNAMQYVKENGIYGDTDYLDELLKTDLITQDQYNELLNQYSDELLENVDDFFGSDNISASDAKKMLDKVMKNSRYDAETKKSVQAAYDRFCKIYKNDVEFNNDGGWWIFGSTDMAEKGNNFSLKDSDGFIYRIQSGGKAEPAIYNMAKNNPDGVFGLRGQIYYKKGGEIYLVETRGGAFDDHYNKLSEKFFG